MMAKLNFQHHYSLEIIRNHSNYLFLALKEDMSYSKY